MVDYCPRIPARAGIGFTVGRNVFKADPDQERPCSLVTVLIQTPAERETDARLRERTG